LTKEEWKNWQGGDVFPGQGVGEKQYSLKGVLPAA